MNCLRARGVFVAGTDTGVGKTRVVVGLVRALRAAGVHANGMKPVAAGMISTDNGMINEDVAAIMAVNDPSLSRADIAPYCFDLPLSPHIGAERTGIVIDPRHIVAAYEHMAAGCDVVVVEGTGGWLCPTGPTATMADVARALRLPVVLVVGLRLGCLNHALLSAQSIASAGAPLIGWIGSVLDAAMPALAENLETLARRLPAPRWATLPHERGREHDAARLAQAAQALSAALAGAAA